ncbi:MAG: FAD-dependent oxidoreductase [Planctomycetota bacterium]|nr:FAD-dependent oxidoreductase [Planctomycetota bacterium]
MKYLDCVIIGAGPAGLSAGVYLARNGCTPVIVGKRPAMDDYIIENYFGCPEAVEGKELIDRGLKQVKKLGISVFDDLVIGYEYDNGHRLTTAGNEFTALAVILAVGTGEKLRSDLENADEFMGRGLSFCAVCDGYTFKGASVVVLGNGDYGANEALVLARHAKRVTLVSQGRDFDISLMFESRLKDAKNIVLRKGEVKSIRGQHYVEGVLLANNTPIECEGIFVATHEPGAAALAQKMGLALTPDGYVRTDTDTCATSVDGIFAAGDCTGGLRQVVLAAAEGAKAAVAASTYLLTSK